MISHKDNRGREPRKRCTGNLRPAPFCITPLIVARVIGLTQRPAARIAQVPVEPVRLVDEVPGDPVMPVEPDAGEPVELPVAPIVDAALLDGPEEPDDAPLVEPVPDAPQSPDWPDAPLPDEFADPEFGIGSGPSVALPPAAKPARRSDVAYRQAKDRDARELESPVDVRLQQRPRIELIRAAAAKLRAHAAPADESRPHRPSIGQRNPALRVTPQIVLPAEQRRARMAAAEAFLRARCILVSVVDRDALVRTYRVSGKRESKLAEEVIELAVSMGMDRDG